MIIFTILEFILVLLGLIGFILTILAPVGIILLIIYLVKKKEEKSKKLLKWSLFLLSGIPVLIITFILFALLNLVGTLLGVNPLANPSGGLMMLPNLQ